MSRLSIPAFACVFAIVCAMRGGQDASRPSGGEFFLQASYPDGAVLSEVVVGLSKAVNRNISLPPDVSRKLDTLKVVLTAPVRIPASKVDALLESILFTYGFVFIPPDAEGLPWTLVDLQGFDREAIRTRARVIAPEEIDAYSARLIMVSVVLKLEHANARSVSASLRPFFPDHGLDRVLPIDGSNALQITALGTTTGSLAKLLREIDREEPAVDEKTSARRKEIAALKARVAALEKKLDAATEKPK